MRPLLLLLLAGLGCHSAATGDPLRPGPAHASTLTDISADLSLVLEKGRLQGACSPMKDRLLCGKSMFFYESFGTGGVPASLVQFVVDNFPDEIGPGFEKLGMVRDPASNLPLGMAPTVKYGGTVDALAFTCASCHFARLPDGRYTVGAPNHAYRYGLQNLALAVFPLVALTGPGSHDPSAIAAVQPLLDRYNADPSLSQKLLATVLPLAGAGMPAFPPEAEAHYAAWLSGTMDFLIEPLALNDGVHTVSKIPALWELPTDEEIRSSGMPHAMLGWTGSTSSMLRFCEGFVTFGGGQRAEWPDERLAPLAEYLYSLRRPANPAPPDGARGQKLFTDRGCAQCHDGPRGSGKKVYRYDEIRTDGALARWLDPTLSGQPCCGAPLPEGETLSHAIKSPRLVGLWAAQRFLHNGSVESLERLLCLDGARPSRSDEPFGDQGHDFGCQLPDDEKRALIHYLLAN